MLRRLLPIAISLVLGGLVFLGITSCRDRQEVAKAALHHKKLDFRVEDFHAAARDGKSDLVREFLTAGMSVNAADAEGNTALLLAAESGHWHLVKVLLDAGADPNAVRSNGEFALILATKAGAVDAVKHLLEAGADPDARDANHQSALSEAVLNEQTACIAPLAEKLPTRSLDYGLQLAALIGHTAILDLLLNLGADVSSRSSEFRTPLMYAAASGHKEAVKMLLERNANPLALDTENNTAAALAEAAGQEEIAIILSEPPPETGASAASGDTPTETPPPSLKGAQFPAGLHLADLLKLDRHQEQVLPFLLIEVNEDGKTALVEPLTTTAELLEVEAGVVLPGTDYEIVSMTHRKKHGKGGRGALIDVSTMMLRHRATEAPLLVQRGLAMRTSQSTSILKRVGTEEHYEAHRGDHFAVGDQTWRVVDIRPTQVVVENRVSLETAVLQR